METLIWIFLATVNDHRGSIGFTAIIAAIVGPALLGISVVDDAGMPRLLRLLLRRAGTAFVVTAAVHGWLALWTPELNRISCPMQIDCPKGKR